MRVEIEIMLATFQLKKKKKKKKDEG